MRKLATASLAVLLGLQPVLATPPTEGVHFTYYTLTIDPDATDRVRFRLPTTFVYEEDAGIGRSTRSPSVFLFMDTTFAPHASTGWHNHPGVVLNTVVEGQVDWCDGNCTRHVLKRGDYFVEENRVVHEVRNSTATPARLIQTFNHQERAHIQDRHSGAALRRSPRAGLMLRCDSRRQPSTSPGTRCRD